MTAPHPPNINSKKAFPFRTLPLLAVSVAGLFLLIRHREIHVYDGFESDGLSWRWSTGRLVPGSFRVQPAVVRAGHGAGEITVRSGDRREAASDDGPASERDELMEAWWLLAHMHRSYRYSFSLYLPADFPIVPTRLVLAQWKQVCEWSRCWPDNPVLAIRYQDGELFITRQDDHARSILYSTKQEMRGRWLDFRFETLFSRDQDGLIDGWLNGEPIVHYRGPTVYQPQRGYPAHGYVYFKTGLYRDEMQQPMTIYIDEYRKDELSR
ncbi:MAG: polysaccharide lyase [Candidatus Sulfotelmatobacter sp.]